MIDIDHNPVETEEGVWTEYKGTPLLIAHVSCMAFQKKLARLQQPFAKKIEKGTLGPEIGKDLLCKAMAGTILKDAKFLKFVRDGAGTKVLENGVPKTEPVPFTEELAKNVLMKQVDVREFVTDYAAELDNYRQEETEEVGKSS